MDNFNKDTRIVMSKEFSEIVASMTGGKYIPVPDTQAHIEHSVQQPSGQTLFMVSAKCETDDPNDSKPTEKKIHILRVYPATVAQVQKMVKLAKKADKDAGIVTPPKPNPNQAKKIVVTHGNGISVGVYEGTQPIDLDDGYDPFAEPKEDF